MTTFPKSSDEPKRSVAYIYDLNSESEWEVRNLNVVGEDQDFLNSMMVVPVPSITQS